MTPDSSKVLCEKISYNEDRVCAHVRVVVFTVKVSFDLFRCVALIHNEIKQPFGLPSYKLDKILCTLCVANRFAHVTVVMKGK